MVTPPPTAGKPSSPAPTAPRLRLTSVEQQKFVGNEQYAEIRLLRIVVTPENAEPPEPEQVALRVTFYERDPATGRLRAGPPLVNRGVGSWESLQPRQFTASYFSPRRGDGWLFYGYRVELSYAGRPQAVVSRPLDLP